MERLTRKLNKFLYVLNCKLIERETFGFNAIQKLGKLEDLEERIGMALEDFYKCVTHNADSFYIIEENEDSEELEVIEVFKEDGSMHFFSNDGFYFSGYAYDTNENYYERGVTSYGHDLFLTQKEAEKALEARKNEV